MPPEDPQFQPPPFGGRPPSQGGPPPQDEGFPLFEIPEGMEDFPYPPDAPGGRRPRGYGRPSLFSKYVEPIMPWMRDMRRMAREGGINEAGETMYNPDRQDWRIMKQDEKQLRHEEIIRRKRLSREEEGMMKDFQWGQPQPPISPELQFELWDRLGIPHT
jgi:hypothetical protein